PNTNRMRDLTPTNVPPDKSSGGGEKFTDFIKTELMPHIDSIYPTASYKMLIGHSLGGLMAINTLINHPEMFNAYVAIDPSMWWDDRKLLNRRAKY
ncbi:MAG TPA: alpha/beta hydrolase-fold protein, partial [Mucilaginibacter sp.]|nr:alpha/beta hydrolase-fold protein [Mucilaginibacter sp.]